MEKTKNFNLAIKILSIILIILLISTIGTISLAADEGNNAEQKQETMETEDKKEEDKQEEDKQEEKKVYTMADVKFNTKVTFTGDTYWFSNGKNVRRSYKDGKIGCGIVSMILKNKKYGVYITGEGWISPEQIQNDTKFISLDFSKSNLKEGNIVSSLKIDGEYINVVSDDNKVITFQNGELKVIGDGTSNLTITTKNGKEINALATVYNGSLSLNIPEMSLSAELHDTNITIADRVNVVPEGKVEAKVVVTGDSIGLEANGNGTVALKVGDTEIVSLGADGNANVTGSLSTGLTGSLNSSQTLTILQRLKVKLNERANMTIDGTHAEATVGAGVGGDTEVAGGDVTLSHTYQEKDPDIKINGNLLGKEVKLVDGKLPIVSGLEKLMKMIAK